MRAATLVTDLLASPACLIGRNGAITQLNDAWRTFAGLPESAGDPPRWPALLHHTDSEIVRLGLRDAIERGAHLNTAARLVAADGTPRWFLLTLHPVDPDAQGEPLWLCIATDIDVLKRRDGELERLAAIRNDMLNVSIDCIKVIGLDGRLTHMNKAGCRSLGVPEDSSFGMPWLPLLPASVRAAGEVALVSVRAGIASRFAGRSVLPGETERHWDNLLTPILGTDGKPTAILCVSRDVTDAHQAQAALRESEERLTIAARVGGLGVWDYDITTDRLHCDDGWYRIMGRDPTPPVRSIAEFRPLIHPDDVESATEVTRSASELMAEGRDYSIVFRIIRPNGDIRWLRSLACLQHRDGVAVRAVGFVVDVTDLWRGELALRDANRALEAEKSSLARKILEDPLTGIGNRRHFDSELAHLWVQAKEHGQSLCVGFIDVDRFKQFNDHYGHLDGDAALRKVALALHAAARHGDLVARYGGEEFAFVLIGTENATRVVERFMAVVAALAIPQQDSPTGRLSISCGAVLALRPALSPIQLLKAGDEALYEAKSLGRDRYVLRVLED